MTDVLISGAGGVQITAGPAGSECQQVRFPLPIFGDSALWAVEWHLPDGAQIIKAAIEYPLTGIVPLTFNGGDRFSDVAGGTTAGQVVACDSFVPNAEFQSVPGIRRNFWGVYVRYLIEQPGSQLGIMYYLPYGGTGGDIGLQAGGELASTLGGLTDKVDSGTITPVTLASMRALYPLGIIAKDGTPQLMAALKPRILNGDSIVYGFAAECGLSGTNRALIQAGIPCIRRAANSSVIDTTTAAYNTPGTDAGLDRAIEVCYGALTEHAINNINSGAEAGASLHTKMGDYCTAVKGRGLIEAGTCTAGLLLDSDPANQNTSSLETQLPNATTESRREDFNTLQRASLPTLCDYVWDRENGFAHTVNYSDPDAGKYRIDLNTNSLRLNADAIHPSTPGEATVKLAAPVTAWGVTDWQPEIITARINAAGDIITLYLDVPTALQDSLQGTTDPTGLTVATQTGGSKTVSFIDIERYSNGTSATQPLALRLYLRDAIRFYEGSITVTILSTTIRVGNFYMRDQTVTIEQESTSRPPVPTYDSFLTDTFTRTTSAGTVGNGWNASGAAAAACDGANLTLAAANQIIKRGGSWKWPSFSATVNHADWTNPNQDDTDRRIEVYLRYQDAQNYYFVGADINQSVLQGWKVGRVEGGNLTNLALVSLSGPNYASDMTVAGGLFKTSSGHTGVWMTVTQGATEHKYLIGVDTADSGPQGAGDIALFGGIGASGGGVVTVKDITLSEATADSTGPSIASGEVTAAGTLALLTITEATWKPIQPESAMSGFAIAGKTVGASAGKRIGDDKIGVRFSAAVGVGLPDRSLSYSALTGNVTDNADTPSNPMATVSGVSLDNNSLADDGGDIGTGRTRLAWRPRPSLGRRSGRPDTL